MGGKPRKKPEPKAFTYDELKEIASGLAGAVVWALKFLDTNSGSSLMINMKTGVARPWQEEFFDRLEKAGLHYDRDAYYAERAKKKRRR
jgi:hypothetical protein